jgi:predicted PurR-regulated permease PerM
MTSQKKKETINTITVLMQILAVALLVWLAYTMRIILIDLILAVTIASAISPAARWGQERKIPRPVTVLVTYLIIAVFYGFMGYLLYTPVREQALLLKENFPGYLDSLNTLYQNLLLQFGERANLFTIHAEELRTIGMRAASSTLSLTTGVFGFILNGIFILFLASYFVVDAESIWNSLRLCSGPAPGQHSRRRHFCNRLEPDRRTLWHCAWASGGADESSALCRVVHHIWIGFNSRFQSVDDAGGFYRRTLRDRAGY